jgi:hypothetical protein
VADLIYRPDQPAPRKVWVQWADAFTNVNYHWLDRDDYEPKDGMLCESIGFVMHESEQSIVLAQSINDGCMDNLITLPRGMVLKVKELKFGR